MLAQRSQVDERARYYERIGQHNMAPLWEVLSTLVTREPVTTVRAAHWSYGEIRPALLEAGSLISAAEAERRVLVLENPGMRGASAITRTLYAGLQVIMPGEVARSHRHSQSALRFVVEGDGAYTAVDGERATMQEGDFIITPSWTWHDHGNPSDAPMIWLDGLDVPLVAALDASFLEHLGEEQQPIRRPEGDALARYGQGLLPVDWTPERLTSPIFKYPYTRTREALSALERAGDPDLCHGYKLRYVNPADGQDAMPTIGAFIQLLPNGFQTAFYRSTDATVFVVAEGAGTSRIGEVSFVWRKRDVFVAPPWTFINHEASAEAVLFSFSDRPVQMKLGLWREERGHL